MSLLDQQQPQQQQEEDYPQIPQSYPMKLPDFPTQDFFFYRLFGGDIIDNLQHQLRGAVKIINKDGKEVWRQEYDAWANEEGISKIIGILYSCGVNKNIFLGNLSHDEIYQRCQSLWIKLAKIFTFGYITYGIKKENRDILIQMVIQQVHSALSRSEGGKEASHISDQVQKVEHRIEQGKQAKQGISPGRFMSRFER